MTSPSSSMAIPHRGQTALRGATSMPPTRNTSSNNLSGSYFGSVMLGGTASINRGRRTSLVSAEMEKKLNRTRRMSEAARMMLLSGAASPPAAQAAPAARPISPRARIPTEMGDLTREWARLMVNQFMLKHDRSLIKRSDTIVNFSVTDCKSSVGEFSCTYQVRTFIILSLLGE